MFLIKGTILLVKFEKLTINKVEKIKKKNIFIKNFNF